MWPITVDLFLGLLWVLKAISTLQAIRWLRRSGREYQRRAMRETGDWEIKKMALIRHLKDTGGGRVIPFGVNDYKLKKVRWEEAGRRQLAGAIHKAPTTLEPPGPRNETGTGGQEGQESEKGPAGGDPQKRKEPPEALSPRPRPVLAFLASVVDKFIYRGDSMALATAVWAYVHTAVLAPHDNDLYQFALPAVAFLSLLVTFLLATETLAGALRFDNYGYYFQLRWHKGRVNRDESIRWFGLRLFRVWIAGATTLYLWQVQWSILTGGALHETVSGEWHGSLWDCLILYLQCFYFVGITMATVGFGDIIPSQGWGQLAAGTIVLSSFYWVTVIFAAFGNRRKARIVRRHVHLIARQSGDGPTGAVDVVSKFIDRGAGGIERPQAPVGQFRTPLDGRPSTHLAGPESRAIEQLDQANQRRTTEGPTDPGEEAHLDP